MNTTKFIIDCASTPTYIQEVSSDTHVKNIEHNVQKSSGTMKKTKIAKIPITINNKTARIKEIIHEGPIKNFLSAAQIIDYLGPVLLTKLEASIVSQEKSRILQKTATQFANRNKKLFYRKH